MTEIATPIIVTIDRAKNLNDLLAERVAATPDKVIVERKTVPDGPWEPLTATGLDAEVVAVAKGLVALGVEPGDRVAIMARTRYEWSLLDWAIWAAGAVSVPVYETSSAEQVNWILTDSGVSLVVVETAAHAATVGQVRTPAVRDVLTIDDGAIDALVAAGAGVADDEITRRRSLARLDDLATIIYTSGTTGRPKGAELTHGNFYELSVNTVSKLSVVVEGENARTLLFMPLAHVFARFVHVLAVAAGAVLGHTPDAKSLVADMQ